MIKRALTTLFLTFCIALGFSQVYDPVDWTYQIEQDGKEATLIFTATIEEGWHVYSQTLESDDGPVATEVTFEANENYELVGKTTESKTYKEYDPNFEMNLTFFKTKAVLKQKIKLKTDKKFKVKGNVYFMVCNESMCLPPSDASNEFVLNPSAKESAPESSTENVDNDNVLALDGQSSEEEADTDHENGNEILDPVKVKFSSKKIGENEYEISASLDIEEHWHVFSSKQDSEDGPIATEFNVFDSTEFELNGDIIEKGTKITKYEEGFEMETHYYEKEVVFSRKIKVDDPSKPIFGELYYQTCIDGKCILPSPVPTFKIDLTTGEDLMAAGEESKTSSLGDCQPKKFEGKESSKEKESLIGMFFLAFLFGLTTLLTPCVFPMIPMTVSFFMKDKGKGIRNAIIFGLSIILIYTLIGTLVSVLFGASFSNWLATHWIPNTVFFLVFVIFAASFFGMFEITMPSWIVNKADKGADRGGLIGVFFMALTLVVVSFSCTGPIVGVILINASQGAVLEPMIGMLGFSLAFAIPFTLFAVFPSMLNKLPQSGGWLNSVKVVLGFLELALALKFLSVADQTYHWGILDRHIYIALWIVIFGLMGVYLLGKIKFSHDSDLPFLKVPRLMFAILVFSFTIYLIPGLFGSPLKMLAGYLPPMSSHEFNLLGAINHGDGGEICDTDPKYSDFLHLPHGIKGYFDYDEAMACAKSQNKPLFIDFTGHGCVNCRKMEASVWSDPRVLKLLKEEFVVVALYCDDKKELPEDKWYESKFDGRLKKTIGDKNLDFQICSFNQNAQPLYVVLDSEEELCAPTIGSEWDADIFYKHLKEAIKVFETRNLLNK